MAESTRRRSNRGLSAILLAVLASSQGASAFVSHGAFSLLPASASASDAARPSQSQHHSRRQQANRAQVGVGARYADSRRASSSLAGALAADNTPVDHTDGWNPVEGVDTGTVSLVGSGPGDPDLMTVAGVRELESADLVIADRLVSKEILGLVSAVVCIGEYVGQHCSPWTFTRRQGPSRLETSTQLPEVDS